MQTMRETFVTTVAEALDADPRLAVVLADITAAQFENAAKRYPTG